MKIFAAKSYISMVNNLTSRLWPNLDSLQGQHRIKRVIFGKTTYWGAFGLLRTFGQFPLVARLQCTFWAWAGQGGGRTDIAVVVVHNSFWRDSSSSPPSAVPGEVSYGPAPLPLPRRLMHWKTFHLRSHHGLGRRWDDEEFSCTEGGFSWPPPPPPPRFTVHICCQVCFSDFLNACMARPVSDQVRSRGQFGCISRS